MENLVIYHDLFIKSSISKVYESVTNPEHLVNWWALKCSGKPIQDEIYNFNFTDAYDWYGKVIKVETNKSSHIKMIKSDDDWNPTSFGFDLESNNSKTTVKFWHKGWLACNDEYRQSSYCWAILLQSLKKYVEKGIVIPFNERE